MKRMVVFCILTICFYYGCKNTGNKTKTGEVQVQTKTVPQNVYHNFERIQIVSFEHIKRDPYSASSSMLKDGHYVEEPFLEEIVLNKGQIDSLYDILYLTTDTPYNTFADCYNPHHAVMFYKGDSVAACYEICFDCLGTRETAGLNIGQLTLKQYCRLYRFFNKTGMDMKKREPYRSEASICN